jgi:hypothetical protein
MSDSKVRFELENTGRESIVINNATVEQLNKQQSNSTCNTDNELARSGNTVTITCESLNLTDGQENTVLITYDQYSSDSGPSYSRQRDVTIESEPSSYTSLTSATATAPSNTSQVLASMQGSGNASDPYIITNIEELQAMNADRDAHFKLGNNIDASPTQTWNNGSGFTPVATYSNRFEGSLDGDGKTISNLYIYNASSWASLFTSTSPNARIHDLNVQNADITGNYYAAILVGLNTGPIRDIKVSGDVKGNGQYTGGVVGLADGYPGGVIPADYNGYDENSPIKDVTASRHHPQQCHSRRCRRIRRRRALHRPLRARNHPL